MSLATGLTWALVLGATPPALQPPGTFHRDEPVARDGERWLALRVGDGEAALIATRVRVRVVEDPLIDAPGERSGREIDAPIEGALVFLRGDGLVEGPVPFAPIDAMDNPSGALRFNGRAYRIDTRCIPDVVREGQQQLACEIVFTQGAHRQVLAKMAGYRTPEGVDILGDDATPRLLFAGDLDRDGRLDLVLDTTWHYNVSRPTLFLSTLAREGELVREAAANESVGC